MKRRTDTTRKRPPKAAQRPVTKRNDKRLAALARRHPEGRKLIDEIRAAPDRPEVTAADEAIAVRTLAKLLDDLSAQHPDARRFSKAVRAALNLGQQHPLAKLLAKLAPQHRDARRFSKAVRAALNLETVARDAEVRAYLRPLETKEEADRARQHDARRAIEDMLEILRTGYEPDPADIPRLAELAARAADHLRTASASSEAGPLLDKALVPSACAAVTLADVVNDPCLKHAPQTHADARAQAERWPRTHYASAERNKQEADHFKAYPVGPSPRLQHRADRAHTAAFSATLKALRQVLPDALHPAAFPALPALLDAGRPIPPRTAEGMLSAPYTALAHFILTTRHTHLDWKKIRTEALANFLAANDEANARQPRTVRSAYIRTRAFLVQFVQNLHTENASKHPAWLRPTPPVIGANAEAWSTTLYEVLRTHRLRKLADSLLPIYDRTVADLAASAEHVAKPSKTAPQATSAKS